MKRKSAGTLAYDLFENPSPQPHGLVIATRAPASHSTSKDVDLESPRDRRWCSRAVGVGQVLASPFVPIYA